MKRITIESCQMYLVTFDVIPPTSIYNSSIYFYFLFDPYIPYPADCSGMLFRLGVSASKANITQSPGFGWTSIVTWSTPKNSQDLLTSFENVSIFYTILCYFQLPFAFLPSKTSCGLRSALKHFSPKICQRYRPRRFPELFGNQSAGRTESLV